MSAPRILRTAPWALVLLLVASCGPGGSNEGSSPADYVFGCSLTVVNDTTHSLVEYTWVLYEEDPAGDIGWDTGTEAIDPAWLPAEEHGIVLGPGVAVTDDVYQLVWRLRFTDDTDTEYTYDVRVDACNGTTLHVAP